MKRAHDGISKPQQGDIFSLVHHELCRAAEEFQEALQGCDFSQKWQLGNVTAHFQDFSQFVQHHFRLEKSLYFPWILQRVSMSEDLMCNSAAEALLERMENLLSTINSTSSVAKRLSMRAEVLKVFSDIVSQLECHRGERALTVSSAVQSNFTEDEQTAIVEQINKAGGFDGMSFESDKAEVELGAKPSKKKRETHAQAEAKRQRKINMLLLRLKGYVENAGMGVAKQKAAILERAIDLIHQKEAEIARLKLNPSRIDSVQCLLMHPVQKLKLMFPPDALVTDLMAAAGDEYGVPVARLEDEAGFSLGKNNRLELVATPDGVLQCSVVLDAALPPEEPPY